MVHFFFARLVIRIIILRNCFLIRVPCIAYPENGILNPVVMRISQTRETLFLKRGKRASNRKILPGFVSLFNAIPFSCRPFRSVQSLSLTSFCHDTGRAFSRPRNAVDVSINPEINVFAMLAAIKDPRRFASRKKKGIKTRGVGPRDLLLIFVALTMNPKAKGTRRHACALTFHARAPSLTLRQLSPRV